MNQKNSSRITNQNQTAKQSTIKSQMTSNMWQNKLYRQMTTNKVLKLILKRKYLDNL